MEARRKEWTDETLGQGREAGPGCGPHTRPEWAPMTTTAGCPGDCSTRGAASTHRPIGTRHLGDRVPRTGPASSGAGAMLPSPQLGLLSHKPLPRPPRVTQLTREESPVRTPHGSASRGPPVSELPRRPLLASASNPDAATSPSTRSAPAVSSLPRPVAPRAPRAAWACSSAASSCTVEDRRCRGEALRAPSDPCCRAQAASMARRESPPASAKVSPSGTPRKFPGAQEARRA